MLILGRKPGESIQIGDNVRITVTEIRGDNVRIGIEAPKSVNVRRCEIEEKKGCQDGLGTSATGN